MKFGFRFNLIIALLFLTSCTDGYEISKEEYINNGGDRSVIIGNAEFVDLLNNKLLNCISNKVDTILLSFVLGATKKDGFKHFNNLIEKRVLTEFKIDSVDYAYFRSGGSQFSGKYPYKGNLYKFPIYPDVEVKGVVYPHFVADTLTKLNLKIVTLISYESLREFMSRKYGLPIYEKQIRIDNDEAIRTISIWVENCKEIQLVHEENVLGPFGRNLYVQYNRLRDRYEAENDFIKLPVYENESDTTIGIKIDTQYIRSHEAF